MTRRTPLVDRLDRWARALEHRDRLRAESNAAHLELVDSMNALGASLVPQDVKDGEMFNVWVEDSAGRVRLLCVRAIQDMTVSPSAMRYDVRWRDEEGKTEVI